ncbi:MAG: hypothetical protein ABSF29_15880 [Tepidisphaeraceae bacterium]|jgi:hypothetical protein
MLNRFVLSAGCTAAAMVLGAGLLHLIPRLGRTGQRLSNGLCRAPGLDWVITYFTVAPLIVGPAVAGWRGFFGAIVGQVAGVMIWTFLHELANPDARRGPRIIKMSNRLSGRWRNMAALWLTAIVTPGFWIIRFSEVAIWPAIARLVGLPRYRSADWVNVSRHKFSGLVGHDLIWCLYCDWMTGVWSLGSEMLRNVESYWCPIRFSNEKKCANCAVDFPDVEQGWVPADGTMAQVVETMETMYADGQRGWFGHPARLTVKGEPVEITAIAGKKPARSEVSAESDSGGTLVFGPDQGGARS